MANSTQTILFVDDETDILKALQRALRPEPYQCLFAASGSEALAVLDSHPVSVLVSDMRMPQMDGLELLKQAMQKQPDTVRLVLSGRFDGDAVITAVNSGQIHRYIIKPWDDDELKTILRNALEVYTLHQEKRQLLARLEEHNRQLEQKVEQRTQQLLKVRGQAEIGKYAAQIVHNIRTPLHALGGALDLMELISADGGVDTSEIDEIIALARTSLKDLRTIVSGILDHARAQEQFHLEKLDINTIIRQELSFFELDPLFHKQVDKQIQLAEKVPVIMGSATQIKQVLDNLIRNAIEAMAQSAVKQLTIGTQSDGRAVTIEVSDTGEGIAAEDLPRIFSGEFTTKAMGAGTGIGLSSVQRIVSAYGGDIGVASAKGKGTSFRVRLPVQQEKQLGCSLAVIDI